MLISGIYLLIFFDTSMAGAYASVEYMTHEQWYAGGLMRSLHRYASDAAVVTILLHMFREFSLDRYRGFRWWSWVTGVPTLWFVITVGITGLLAGVGRTGDCTSPCSPPSSWIRCR